VAVFIFGNKLVDDNVVIADGMLEEFQIARDAGRKIVSIGSTGGAAKQIFDKIKKHIDEFAYLTKYLEALETEVEPEKLVKLVSSIVCELRES
jgi:hypothetical protein